MTNKPLYTPRRPTPNYKPSRNFTTPLKSLLLTLDDGDVVNALYPRKKPFLEIQEEKFMYILERGGVYSEAVRNLQHMPILSHLLLENDTSLARRGMQAGFLDFGFHTGDSIFSFFIRRMKRNPLLFLLYEDVCKGLTVRGNGVHQNVLLNPNILKKKQRHTLTMMTECVLRCNFVFRGHSYKIRSYDSPSRLYNLYRAGVYLIDDLDYASDLKETDPITKHVIKFIEESKTPFKLEFLCKMFIKRHLGPRNQTIKIKALNLTKIVEDYVLWFKYTQGGRLTRPNVWCSPQTRIPGKVKYHKDEYDLI